MVLTNTPRTTALVLVNSWFVVVGILSLSKIAVDSSAISLFRTVVETDVDDSVTTDVYLPLYILPVTIDVLAAVQDTGHKSCTHERADSTVLFYRKNPPIFRNTEILKV